MLRFIILLILQLLLIPIKAQELTIKSFTELTNDIKARSNPREDLNGNPCALVKVRIAVKDATFKGMVIGDVDYSSGEYYVYLPEGAKRLSVSTPNYLVLDVRFEDYGIGTLKAKTTYLLTVSTTNNTSSAVQDRKYQYIVFNVTPKEAMLKLDNEELTLTDGKSMKYVPFGKYSYHAELSGYHPEEGLVEVSDPINKKIVNINLKPAFGWITIPETNETANAKVYIDNNAVGAVPINDYKLVSGKHIIKVIKDMYKPYETTITVEDSKRMSITPSFAQNYSNVSLTIDDDAEIWINGEMKAKSKWSGKLSFGNYLFETKKDGHKNGEITKNISNTDYKLSIKLPQPTPIYGSIRIEVEPALSKVKIDGKNVGETPLILDKVLIGEHKIEVSSSDFWPIDTTLVVKENITSNIFAKLTKGTEKYVVKKEADHYGMIDLNDNKVVDFIYDSFSDFSDGIAIVSKGEKKGLISHRGVEIAACIYDNIKKQHNGLYLVKKNDRYGCIDESGDIIIPMDYDNFESFENGIAIVEKDKRYGYIDETNRVVIDIKYDDLYYFSEGLAVAKIGTKYGAINENGDVVIPFKYDKLWPFVNGYAKIKINDKYGFIDNSDKVVIPAKYNNAENFTNDYVIVKKGKKMGLESVKFKKIKCKYDGIQIFSCGLAAAKQKDKWGYVNSKGKWVIKPSYTEANSFSENLAGVCNGINYGFVDLKGDIVIPMIYDQINRFEDGRALVKKGKLGMIDKLGNTVIPFLYDDIGSFVDGKAIAEIGDNKGIIDEQGSIVIPFEYYALTNFNNKGIAYGYKLSNKQYYSITTDGRVSLADESCLLFVETRPAFPGGMEKLQQWLSKNLKYPASAQENGTQGRVVVQFIVNKDGSIVEPKVIKSVHPLLDKEAVRVVSSMPKWTPGTMNGKPKRVRFTIPVTFRLQ